MNNTTRSVQNSGKRPRPVLMIPLRRCGSHALRLRLNLNPEFYAPYPLHIVDFMPQVPRYGDLHDDAAYFQMIVDVVGLETVSMVKWPDIVFDPIEIFESIKHEPRSVHRVVWELLLRSGSKRGAKVVMDKSLDSVHYAEELMALFPDLLFLNVVRDPRAQVSSMNKAIIHDFDVLLNAQTWVKAYEKAADLSRKYPDRVLTIRFEDFVSNQEAVLRTVCKFFGIEFFTEMLDVAHSREAKQISTMSQLWESNEFPPIPANVDKFKKNLSVDEITVIETLTGDIMDRFGYQRMTAGNADVSLLAVAAARERSAAKKLKAWDELEQRDRRDYQLRRYRVDYLDMISRRNQKEVASIAGSHLNQVDKIRFQRELLESAVA